MEQDWTGQIGRRVGMWVGRGLVQTEKAEGIIVRATEASFWVKLDDEDREVRFNRKHEWSDSDFRRQFGHASRRNPSRCYPNPLPKN